MIMKSIFSKIKNNKTAFTLTEVLAVLVVLGIIAAVIILSVSKYQNRMRTEYYDKLDATVLATGKTYFKDNPDLRPIAILESSSVSYNDNTSGNELLEKKYLSSVNEYNSNTQCSGKVVVAKTDDGYIYKNCMICDKYTSYDEFSEPNAIDNLCFFSENDTLEYNTKEVDNAIHVGNYSSESIKKLLEISNIVTRKNKNNNVLYTVNDKDNLIYPKNISGIDFSSTRLEDKKYKVVYELKNKKDCEVNDCEKPGYVTVYQLPAPDVKNIDGKVIVKRDPDNKIEKIILNAAMNNDSSNLILDMSNYEQYFGANYDSDFKRYEYKESTSDNWNGICQVGKDQDYSKCEIPFSNFNSGKYMFRVVGKSKVLDVEQFGVIGEYDIVNEGKQISLIDCNNNEKANFVYSDGFMLPNHVDIPNDDSIIFRGYSYKENVIYNSSGYLIKTINDLSNDPNPVFNAVCINKNDIEFIHDEFMTSYQSTNTYDVLADSSTIFSGSTVYFNEMIYNNDIIKNNQINEVSIDYENSGAFTSCNVDNNESFKSHFSKYSDYVRYYCGSHSYTHNSKTTFTPKIKVQYIDVSGSSKTYTKEFKINFVAKYNISYEYNNGTAPSTGVPSSYTYGIGATINGRPTRSGYTFNGWSSSSSLTSLSFAKTISTTATGNKSFYAKWCQNCASVSNGSCSLNADTAGTCNYITNCNTGYTLTSGSGTRNPVCTLNKVKVKYYIQSGCTIDSKETGHTWAINSDGYLTYDNKIYYTSMNYGATDGDLRNYSNSEYFKISCDGYKVPNNYIWRNKSFASKSTKFFTYNSDTKASDLCDASKNDCETTVYLNRLNQPTCDITFSGTLGTSKWYKNGSDARATITVDNDYTTKYGLSSSNSAIYDKDASESKTYKSGKIPETTGRTYYGFVKRTYVNGSYSMDITNTCSASVKVDYTAPVVSNCGHISLSTLESKTGKRDDTKRFYKCYFKDETSKINISTLSGNYCINLKSGETAGSCYNSNAICTGTTSSTRMVTAETHGDDQSSNGDNSYYITWLGTSSSCYSSKAAGVGFNFSMCDKAGNCADSGYKYGS